MDTSAKACVFFDRDGIVNRDPAPKRYVERLEEFHLHEAFFDALKAAHDKGFVAVIITNQKGVGSGVMPASELERIHGHLLREAAARGTPLLGIFACTATDDAHPHRKPNPGMLLEAAGRHGIDLARSWMVGDSERDAVAGRRAGCHTVLVKDSDKPTTAEHHLRKLDELPGFLRSHL